MINNRLVQEYRKRIEKFRKKSESQVRPKYKNEKLIQLPTLKNAILYVYLGCENKGIFMGVALPSQLNWPDHEFNEKTKPLIKPYGHFIMQHYESHSNSFRKNTWIEFESSDIQKKGKPIFSKVKLDKTFLKEKIKCDVESWAIQDEETWRLLRVVCKNVKSKLLKRIVEIKLSSDIHDYNIHVINKKHFNLDYIKTIPLCTEKEVPLTKFKASFIENNTGIMVIETDKPNRGQPTKSDDGDNLAEIYVRFNGKLFDGGGYGLKRKINKYVYKGAIASLRTDLEYKHEKPGEWPPEVQKLIKGKKLFIDVYAKARARHNRPMPEDIKYEKYYSCLAIFQIDPKSVKFNRWENTVTIEYVEIKKHFTPPKIKFNKMRRVEKNNDEHLYLENLQLIKEQKLSDEEIKKLEYALNIHWYGKGESTFDKKPRTKVSNVAGRIISLTDRGLKKLHRKVKDPKKLAGFYNGTSYGVNHYLKGDCVFDKNPKSCVKKVTAYATKLEDKAIQLTKKYKETD